jgi:hypothetical protein
MISSSSSSRGSMRRERNNQFSVNGEQCSTVPWFIVPCNTRPGNRASCSCNVKALLQLHCCYKFTAATTSLLLQVHCCCNLTAATTSLQLQLHCCCNFHCCYSFTAATTSLLLQLWKEQASPPPPCHEGPHGFQIIHLLQLHKEQASPASVQPVLPMQSTALPLKHTHLATKARMAFTGNLAGSKLKSRKRSCSSSDNEQFTTNTVE